jgi:hypothetical protein
MYNYRNHQRLLHWKLLRKVESRNVNRSTLKRLSLEDIAPRGAEETESLG